MKPESGANMFFGQMFDIRPQGGAWFLALDGGDWREGNIVLQVYWAGERQFYNSTGTEKYSFTVLP